MTLGEFLVQFNSLADQQSLPIWAGAAAFPLVGTIAAWIGKGGQTDADGRVIASLIVGTAAIATLLEGLFVAAFTLILGRNMIDVSAALLLAPVASLILALIAIRKVFPLSQLGSWKTLTDVSSFLLASAAVVWICSKFWGFGVFFVGSAFQLIIIVVLAVVVMRRMFRRAFGLTTSRALDRVR